MWDVKPKVIYVVDTSNISFTLTMWDVKFVLAILLVFLF